MTLPSLLLPYLTLLSLLTLTSAYSPTSFCKCTCFSNSTIILLDAPSSHSSRSLPVLLPRTAQHDDIEELLPEDPPIESSPPPPDDEGETLRPEEGEGGGGDNRKENNNGDRKEYRAGNCNDCNRQFCLDYNLPICKGAGMEDVATTCFQRDSRKDEAVVLIFIFATAGLLIWAVVKPWVGKWVESARERRSYIPVSSQGDT
ncbi:hypothetical protein JMJ35_008748 [Cladonia borealis]|uniref:Uncharacterized protein n=1 Tax=Cladonia borealis TaxID=184061 RepID=A0AA39QSM6_9LECA|nr:hypothetical protein JMJ35_008748 [Cladonia borealis]